MCGNKESIIENLGIENYKENLYSSHEVYTDRSLIFYSTQALRFNADYFYCLYNSLESRNIPLLYIYDERHKAAEEYRSLIDINKRLWTNGEITLALFIYDDEYKIIDTRKHIESYDTPAFWEGIGRSIQYIDERLRERIFKGQLLEDKNDYYAISSYQMLLDHIKTNILDKSKNANCDQTLLRKLLVKFLLIKYIESQKDKNGNAVFESDFFKKFMPHQTSSPVTFCNVLKSGNVVELLRHLQEHFNGGIFKLTEDEARMVSGMSFDIVANALDGDKDYKGQISIWKLYDFQYLPIEFISRLYEAFVVVGNKKKGTGSYYTPPHLAKILVDEVLPFNRSVDFENFKIADTSCGSGIFLVLAFKRLITLWMLDNNKDCINGIEDIHQIQNILKKCIYGVDINYDALLITATSLQIELLSHISPIEIRKKVRFDDLFANENLIHTGFFKWYKQENKRFDLILGNPPFKISTKEQDQNIKSELDDDLKKEYYYNHKEKKTTFPKCNPALTILYQALSHLLKKETGELFMIMPASSFLYNTSSLTFRNDILSRYNLEKIVDFTPLREHLWGTTKIATIAVKINNNPKQNKGIEHIIVRNLFANEKGNVRFIIDKYDKFYVPRFIATSKAYIWKANLMGGGGIMKIIEKYHSIKNATIGSFFNKNLHIGFTHDESSDKNINLKGHKVLNADLFDSDIMSEDMWYICEKDDIVRYNPKNFYTPNILIRLNAGRNLPIIYNEEDIIVPNGVLAITDEDADKLKFFTQYFRANRDFYKFWINVHSPKTFVQQGDCISINRQEIESLPMLTENGTPIPFPPCSQEENDIINDVQDLTENWSNYDKYVSRQASAHKIEEFCQAFCNSLNHVYETENYRFNLKRLIINKDYVWVTFEHSTPPVCIEKKINSENKNIFGHIMEMNISESLVIYKIIKYYGEKNCISFIKPNKNKFWTKSIAYRDAENVKADLFKEGYL